MTGVQTCALPIYIENDVLAGQRAGLYGVLVRTGKFLPEVYDTATGEPDVVVDSFADVPALLDS